MLDPTTTTVIANPAAAGGRVGAKWTSYEEQIRQHLGPVTVLRTEREGHGITLANEAVLAGARTLLSLGGDGTHNEVVNGIMASSPEPGAITLGILPAGTGGDFRRLLVHSRGVRASAAGIGGAESSSLDLGKVSFVRDDGSPAERWFVNIASFGIGGLVDRIVSTSSKRLGGTPTFFLATLRALGQYTPATVHLEVDGVDKGTHEITNVQVCNGRYAGGGMMFAPEARLGDGLFDITLIRKMSVPRTILTSRRYYDGSHVQLSEVEVFQGSRLVATSIGDAPAYLDIDGEAPGTLPATFEIFPGAINILDARPEVR